MPMDSCTSVQKGHVAGIMLMFFSILKYVMHVVRIYAVSGPEQELNGEELTKIFPKRIAEE